MYVSNEEQQAYQRRRLRYSAELASKTPSSTDDRPSVLTTEQGRLPENQEAWARQVYQQKRWLEGRQAYKERWVVPDEPQIVYYEAPAPRLNFLEKVLAFGAGYYAVSRLMKKD